MLIENNTLVRLDSEDVVDGLFIAPDDLFYIGDDFGSNDIKRMILPNVKEIGDRFLYWNTSLRHLEMPNVEKIGNYFLFWNDNALNIEMYKIREIGCCFLFNNNRLTNLDIPNIKIIGNEFMPTSSKFNYTNKIIKALKGRMYVECEMVDNKEYLRKYNLRKILDI